MGHRFACYGSYLICFNCYVMKFNIILATRYNDDLASYLPFGIEEF